MSQPFVSVVIPTRNGMDTLPPVVDAVRGQRANFAFEIVAVDSSSTDGSEAFLRIGVDRFVSIPAATFNHGMTRNLGVQYARGELVVMLVQDAEPASEEWLQELVEPLIGDMTVAGAFARQQPRDGASALTREYASRWVAASRESRVVSLTAHDYERLLPAARLDACAFDNVCSCIRRSVWLQHPFRATPIAEDLEWAREILLAGWKIAYVPSAVVLHSHDRSVADSLRGPGPPIDGWQLFSSSKRFRQSPSSRAQSDRRSRFMRAVHYRMAFRPRGFCVRWGWPLPGRWASIWVAATIDSRWTTRTLATAFRVAVRGRGNTGTRRRAHLPESRRERFRRGRSMRVLRTTRPSLGI